jgi:2-amino-4-hydroxy-6-hydroxymethyldihydropteridine diphosphokinase
LKLNAAPEHTTKTKDVYLALGSNIRPERFIKLAVEELRKRFPVKAVSSVWQSPAEGFNGADFLNAVVHIQTDLSSVSLKYRVLRPLEAQLGRVRTEHKYSPRTIDIDILLFGDRILDPEIWEQPHLAVPLAELLPDLDRPDNGKTLAALSDHFLKMEKIHQTTEVQF